MNNFQIEKLLHCHLITRSTFAGVFALDTLPESVREKRPSAYVVNTEPISEEGEHWVCFYFPKDVQTVEYFDSLGKLLIKGEFIDFIGAHGLKIHVNHQPIQDAMSKNCGQYVMFYILCRCMNFSMKSIIAFLRSEKENGTNVDEIVVKTVAKNFGFMFKNR